MDISCILKDFIYCRGDLQEFINRRFKANNCVVVDTNIFKTISTHKCVFMLSRDSADSIPQVFSDYEFYDIKQTDIVLDIGANVGGFSIHAALLADKVYSVEPIPYLFSQLSKNIMLNGLTNITPLCCALGDGSTQKISWGDGVVEMRTTRLDDIIKMCGGRVDFMKIDCEGAEWTIKPEYLIGVRRIEAEVHDFDKKRGINNFLNILKEAGYETRYKIDDYKRTMIVHAINTEEDS